MVSFLDEPTDESAAPQVDVDIRVLGSDGASGFTARVDDGDVIDLPARVSLETGRHVIAIGRAGSEIWTNPIPIELAPTDVVTTLEIDPSVLELESRAEGDGKLGADEDS